MEDYFKNFNILTCDKDNKWYPRGMKDLTSMPPVIYYKGDIKIVNCHKNVAVIGSRKSSAEGLKLSYEAGRIGAELGINIVNGLALGCDTEALKGALSVGGKCIGIMPCGLNQIQPKSNFGLAEEILEKGGCLISQYPIGTVVRDYQYVERDRLQSAIGQGVLIIEAQEKSGTMHTANFAIGQYRRLACYYHLLVNSASGNKYLEERGKVKTIKTETDLRGFFADILGEEIYEQISFDI